MANTRLWTRQRKGAGICKLLIEREFSIKGRGRRHVLRVNLISPSSINTLSDPDPHELLPGSSHHFPVKVVQVGPPFPCFFNHVILGDGQLAPRNHRRRASTVISRRSPSIQHFDIPGALRVRLRVRITGVSLGSAHPAFTLRLYWSRGWWWELSVVLMFEDRVLGR